MIEFAKRLRESLRIKEISRTELARRINISQRAVDGYCSGKSEPNTRVFILICKELDVRADYLLGLCEHLSQVRGQVPCVAVDNSPQHHPID